MTVTKAVDRLSPTLHRLAAEGKPVSVEIRLGRAIVRIPNALIASLSVSRSADDAHETLELNGDVTVEIESEDAGSAAAPAP